MRYGAVIRHNLRVTIYRISLKSHVTREHVEGYDPHLTTYTIPQGTISGLLFIEYH